MERPRFRIKHLFWLMMFAAVSSLVARISGLWMFLIVVAWISIAMTLFCRGTLRIGIGKTMMPSFLVLDLCGAHFIGITSWVVRLNPSAYSNSISLGDPATAFMIGCLAFSPIATVFALVSAATSYLILEQHQIAKMDRPSDTN